MFIQRKALYNLLQLNLNKIQSGDLHIAELKPWQTENYREKSTEELLDKLQQLHLGISSAELNQYASMYDSPEELCQSIATDREPLEQDHIFLTLFELWRRLFPEKRTISIFCDELDYLMMNYDMGKRESVAELQDGLDYLQQILDDHVDKGMNPKEAFKLLQTFFATDVESFLFDYILELIDSCQNEYASEIADGFIPYVQEEVWFEYLKGRIALLEDPEDGYQRLEKIVAKVNEKTDLDLIEELLSFLATSGNHSLFYQLATKTLTYISTEDDFKEMLEICYSHYDYLELKQPSLDIAQIFYGREKIPLDAALDSNDPDLLTLKQILNQKLTL